VGVACVGRAWGGVGKRIARWRIRLCATLNFVWAVGIAVAGAATYAVVTSPCCACPLCCACPACRSCGWTR
jgi:hypothetical protein